MIYDLSKRFTATQEAIRFSKRFRSTLFHGGDPRGSSIDVGFAPYLIVPAPSQLDGYREAIDCSSTCAQLGPAFRRRWVFFHLDRLKYAEQTVCHPYAFCVT